MQNIYTYFLYHKPTGFKYYGAKYSKSTTGKELWNTYFTSSKRVKELIIKYGKESFVFKKHKTFNSVIEALSYESYVLTFFNAINRDDWLNQNNRGKNFNSSSLETRRKISLAHKGRKGTFTGMKHTEVSLRKMKGRIISENSKEKIRLAKCRYFYKVIAPDNSTFIINSITLLAKQTNLNGAGFRRILKSGTKYKGYSITYA